MNTLALLKEEKEYNDDQVVIAKTNRFAIEKGVPIPTWHNNNLDGYTGKFPFHEMKVGDSFLIPCSPITQDKEGTRVSAAGHDYKKRWNSKFRMAYRKVTGGIRVWRIRCKNSK